MAHRTPLQGDYAYLACGYCNSGSGVYDYVSSALGLGSWSTTARAGDKACKYAFGRSSRAVGAPTQYGGPNHLNSYTAWETCDDADGASYAVMASLHGHNENPCQVTCSHPRNAICINCSPISLPPAPPSTPSPPTAPPPVTPITYLGAALPYNSEQRFYVHDAGVTSSVIRSEGDYAYMVCGYCYDGAFKYISDYVGLGEWSSTTRSGDKACKWAFGTTARALDIPSSYGGPNHYGGYTGWADCDDSDSGDYGIGPHAGNSETPCQVTCSHPPHAECRNCGS